MKHFSLFLAYLIISFSSSAQSIVYVTPTGAGNSSGSSWTNALAGTELPNRIAIADSGSQFWVAVGTYKPTTTTDRTASFSIASGVSVYGGFAGTETTLSARKINLPITVFPENSSTPIVTVFSGDIGQPGYESENSIHVVQFTNADAGTRLDGVSITAGFANVDSAFNNVGSGIYNNGSYGRTNTPTIANCTIYFNTASSDGAGIYNNGYLGICNPVFINCYINSNHTVNGLGGGMYNNGSGGICNPIIRNCALTGNFASQGSAMHNEGSAGNCSPVIVNCIFKGNLHEQANGGVLFNRGISGNCQPIITNSIFWGNSYSHPSIHNEAASASVTYSDIEDSYPGIGNINQDPRFFNFYSNDFRLLKNSPAINAGDPSTLSSNDSTDFEGKPRIVGDRIDMGVIEYTPNSVTGIVRVSPTGYFSSGSSWSTPLNGYTLQAALSEAAPGTIFWLAEGTYYPTFTYGDRRSSFFIPSGVKVYGGFAGTETDLDSRRLTQPSSSTLSGQIDTSDDFDNSLHVVTFKNASFDTYLDGVVITGGNANISGGSNPALTDYGYAGGGILNIADDSLSSSPQISNCSIYRNKAGLGGGLFTINNISLTKCDIENNTADGNGGGIFTSGGNITLINCRITNNVASLYGGGLFSTDSTPKNGSTGDNHTILTNCLLLNNKANYGGGISISASHVHSFNLFTNCSMINNTGIFEGGGIALNIDAISTGSLTVKNSVVWGNNAPTNSFISDSSPSGTDNHFKISYSLIQNGYPGPGNINTNPFFSSAIAGDFHLKSNSPAINAGDPNTVGLPTTDLNGQPRIQDGRVDIGAYEFSPCYGVPCLPFTVERKK